MVEFNSKDGPVRVYGPEPAVKDAIANPELAQFTKDMANAILLQACDGYANHMAFLGAESPLLSSGTFVRSGLSRQHELLTAAYRENWIARRIIDMVSEDITRGWYRLNTSRPEEDIEDIRKAEARHSIKQEITNAIRWARLYGGSIAIMVTSYYLQTYEKPFNPKIVLPGDFAGLWVLDRSMVTPSIETVTDLSDPDYGTPMYYEVDLMETGGTETRHVNIHHSWVLHFTGRELPPEEAMNEEYWGASELEALWDELMKRSSTSANIAQLVFQANIMTLKMGNLGADMLMGSDRTRQSVMQAIENENRLRTSYGLQVVSAEDAVDNHPYNFAGLSEIYEDFMLDLAGASGIPVTKLFGRSPQGMNATGEADMRNYYDMIAQEQERMLRPALEKLMPFLVRSCLGFYPEDLEIIFEPQMSISLAERAELSMKMAEEIKTLYEAGLITLEEAREEMKARGKPLGSWGKMT